MTNPSKDKDSTYWKNARDGIQLAIIICTALLSAYGFVLKDIIRPGQEPTALNVTAKLKKVGGKGAFTLIHTFISTNNPTKRRIYVPAFWYTIVGQTFSTEPLLPPISQATALKSIKGKELVCTYIPITKYEVLAQKRLVSKDAWWEPNETTNDESIITIPRGKFDVITMYVRYLHTRFISDVDDIIWSSNDAGWWLAQFSLKSNIHIPLESWQVKTASGHNWFITCLELGPD